MENNRVVTNFCVALLLLVVAAGCVLAIMTGDWLALGFVFLAVLGFVGACGAISLLSFVMFAPFLSFVAKLIVYTGQSGSNKK